MGYRVAQNPALWPDSEKGAAHGHACVPVELPPFQNAPGEAERPRCAGQPRAPWAFAGMNLIAFIPSIPFIPADLLFPLMGREVMAGTSYDSQQRG